MPPDPWVVARLHHWDSCEPPVRVDDESIGFLKVYPSREQAEAAADGVEVYRVREVE